MNDREKAKAEANAAFIAECQKEYREKPLAESNRTQVQILNVGSYLWNAISIITGAFLMWWLQSGYEGNVALILCGLLLVIVFIVEAGKRLLIGSIAHGILTGHRGGLLVYMPVLVVCVAFSMTASYFGGSALATETATPPARVVSAEADSLRMAIANEQKTIEALQATTWKGRVTRTANQGINKAKERQVMLTDRLATLEAQADAQHMAAVSKHKAKHLNMGIVLGLIAAFSDLFLIGFLARVKWLKRQVVLAHVGARHKHSQTTVNEILTQAGTHNGTQERNALNNGTERNAIIGFKRNGNGIKTHKRTGNTGSASVPASVRGTHNGTERIRNCDHCGNAYTAKRKHSKFCSKSCRIENFKARKATA